ncbi:dephospho-CoA kinase [Actinomyces sp. zg-332]|uniref:dephospho-CoA kinase n=1 Tax=Actinomyces sp. zg-332 TaxID=2708340 RepID=UPI00141E4274|nr:dephospho-CoA kinase [Actinomyces sp. zg-332]QPK93671.1 dephospho-CoA kinase [Actinomyces sp. zg-332]
MGYKILRDFSKKSAFECVSIGLIGTIGSGKTTVREIFSKYGVKSIDADYISRKLYVKNSITYEKIVRKFGTKILNFQGDIDRKVLGEIVFSDKEKLALLEEVTHKDINNFAENFLSSIPNGKVGLYESTKLIETGIYKKLDIIICVQSEIEKQLSRLAHSRNMSEKEVYERISNQKSDTENAKIANIVLENNEDLQLLEKNVIEILQIIKKTLLKADKL